MMINISPSAQPEGPLPPPRAFGEANTFTLPQGRSSLAMAPTRGDQAPSEADALRFGLIPADAGPLTITF